MCVYMYVSYMYVRLKDAGSNICVGRVVCSKLKHPISTHLPSNFEARHDYSQWMHAFSLLLDNRQHFSDAH